MTRRTVIRSGGFGLGAVFLAPMTGLLNAPRSFAAAPPWQALLGRSLAAEHDYRASVEGEIPAGLRGSYFLNGPGLFERDGYRKRNLLDGDGMIRAYDFSADGVRYRNRFVRTKKFIAEDAAGAFEFATWTTRKPGGMLANLAPDIPSQAGVTALMRDGELWAVDEGGAPYALDPESLKTLGVRAWTPGEPFNAKAHVKRDPVTGEWVLTATDYGRTMTLGVLVLAADGSVKTRFSLPSPRQCYTHDFFATRNYVVFNLQPMMFHVFGFLAGAASFSDSLVWEPEAGNILVVVRRDGAGGAVMIKTPASFMWHALNAWEEKDAIIADFVGYEAPDHFNGPNAMFRTLMTGRLGVAEKPGAVRRYRIDLAKRRAAEEILAADSHEFPTLKPADAMRRQRVGYFTTGRTGALNDGIAAMDFETGRRDAFYFGAKASVGEPLYAPGPGGAGYLLAEALDGAAGRGFLAVFRADAVAAGPVAKVHLKHHAPFGTHGVWRGA